MAVSSAFKGKPSLRRFIIDVMVILGDLGGFSTKAAAAFRFWYCRLLTSRRISL
jgi:hypothetical protein